MSHRLAQELLTATAWHREVSYDSGGGGGADLGSDGVAVCCYQTQDLSLDSEVQPKLSNTRVLPCDGEHMIAVLWRVILP